MHFNQQRSSDRKSILGFTLAEVVIAIAIIALVFSGTIMAYVQTTRRAEWSGYSLAAEALSIQQLEQARSAVWDPSLWPEKNELTNLNLKAWSYNSGTKTLTGYSWTNLDIPVSSVGGGNIYATNYVTLKKISSVAGYSAVSMYMIQVDTVWPFTAGTTPKLFTNTIATYIAPDNRDLASTL